jgi:hypothetical protein
VSLQEREIWTLTEGTTCEGEDIHTQEEYLKDKEDEMRLMHGQSQGISGNHQKLGEAWGRPPPSLRKEPTLLTLGFALLAPRTLRK